MNISQLCSLIEERKNELFELLSELVKMNSESFATTGNEEACAHQPNEYMECDSLVEYTKTIAAYILKVL